MPDVSFRSIYIFLRRERLIFFRPNETSKKLCEDAFLTTRLFFETMSLIYRRKLV